MPAQKRTGAVRRANPRPAPPVEFDPTKPAAFDLDAFIAGVDVEPATRTVAVTVRPAEAAELEELYVKRDQLTALVEEAKAASDKPRRMGAKSNRGAELVEVLERIAELEAAVEGTWMQVRMRPLLPSEQDDVRRLKLDVGVPLASAIFERTATIRPAGDDDAPWGEMDAAGWARLCDIIGPQQYLTLDQTHTAVTYAKVTPDFYGRFSASRATRSTSAS